MKSRIDQLCPNRQPRWVRCYDNRGKTIDRYTVVYTGNYANRNGVCQYIHMSAHPFHPQGVGMHNESRDILDRPNGSWPPAIGRKNYLGVRIPFADLPPDCQRLVLSDYRELWRLPPVGYRRPTPKPQTPTKEQ